MQNEIVNLKNILQMAPHTQKEVISEDWNRPYTREQAAFPAVSKYVRLDNKRLEIF